MKSIFTSFVAALALLVASPFFIIEAGVVHARGGKSSGPMIHPVQKLPQEPGITQTHPHTYESLKLHLQESIDAVNLQLADAQTAKLKSEIDASLAKMKQLKSSYFSTLDRNKLKSYVSEYKKVKFKLKPLTDSMAPVIEKPFEVLELLQEYESDTLVVNWTEIDAMTATFKVMVFSLAQAESLTESIYRYSEEIVKERLAQGDSLSIALYDEADEQAVEKYLNDR